MPVDKDNRKQQFDNLVQKESTHVRETNAQGHPYKLTLTQGNLTGSAGIDLSNGDGYFVLWPDDPSNYASLLADKLRKHYAVTDIGVVITDSRSQPLRLGAIGCAIGSSGISAVVDYAKQEDLFGRPFSYQKSNVVDNIAAAAVLVMGEGNEQTPIAHISDVPERITFAKNARLEDIKLDIDDDVYRPMLRSIFPKE